MRHTPTNKSKVADFDTEAKVAHIAEMSDASLKLRKEVIAYMGEASYLLNGSGDVIAQRVRTKTGQDRLDVKM